MRQKTSTVVKNFINFLKCIYDLEISLKKWSRNIGPSDQNDHKDDSKSLDNLGTEISKMLEQDREYTYKYSLIREKYRMIYFWGIMLFLAFLVIFLADKDNDLLLTLVDKFSSIFLGALGGYGYKSYLDNKKTDSDNFP
ncbi:MAG: hypothetical protein HXX13_03965 [Bacteroidetes bacterium]|nr:hypothetical protein [Bacteroidota bacterium]